MHFSRREFLDFTTKASLAGTLGLLACQSKGEGDFVKLLPFINEGDAPLDKVTGEGLSGRLSFNLTRLNKDNLIIPNDEFYIRTRRPDRLGDTSSWEVSIGGLVGTPQRITAKQLKKQSRPMGVYLLECSGNSAFRHYGLLSAANWSGVRIKELLKSIDIDERATQVLVSGFDDHSADAEGSVKGASWVFDLELLKESDAFLATGMNGQTLPDDHGAPVRLLVPNWYGCSCIKWVNEIRLVDEQAPATSQMQEFAGRTHQERGFELAKDFQPAEIDLAAMPVRVEKWEAPQGISYRVIGVKWGQSQRVRDVKLHIYPDGPTLPVTQYLAANDGWSLWQCNWKPTKAAQYELQLKAVNNEIRTRRLDNGYYTRSVDIHEI